MEAADLGSQESNQMSVSPGRAGADVPSNDNISVGALQWTVSPTIEHESSKSPTNASGSLRTTRRIGAASQASPEHQPRTSSVAAKVLSPPLAGSLPLPTSPQASQPQIHNAPEPSGNSRSTAVDHRPAVPSKPPSGSRQAELQASLPIDDKQNNVAPQRRSKTDVAGQKERPKSLPDSQPSQTSRKGPIAPSQPVASPKEKEKKSTWAKLGLSRSMREEADLDDAASIASTSSGSSSTFGRKGKKAKKDKVPTEISPEKKVPLNNFAIDKGDKQEGTSSFFGGLFGKKKAEQNEPTKKDGSLTPTPMQMPTPPPTASGMLTPDGKYINFYRLPIHIERAVYRLSHIKLANPRRPLYEQVLISNLMFWYLG